MSTDLEIILYAAAAVVMIGGIAKFISDWRDASASAREWEERDAANKKSLTEEDFPQ